jgi:hypothetical protein
MQWLLTDNSVSNSKKIEAKPHLKIRTLHLTLEGPYKIIIYRAFRNII